MLLPPYPMISRGASAAIPKKKPNAAVESDGDDDVAARAAHRRDDAFAEARVPHPRADGKARSVLPGLYGRRPARVAEAHVPRGARPRAEGGTALRRRPLLRRAVTPCRLPRARRTGPAVRRARPVGRAPVTIAVGGSLRFGRDVQFPLQLAHEARTHRRLALAVEIAALGARQKQFFLRAGDRDVHEPPLLLQPRGVVDGARGRHDVLLQSDDEHALEFQSLDGVDGRDRHIVAAVHLIGVRIERDLLQIVGERRFGIHAHELVDGVEKFLDIGAFGDGLVRLVGILSAHPRSVDETAHELVHRHRLRFEDDLLEIRPEGAQFCLRAAADA